MMKTEPVLASRLIKFGEGNGKFIGDERTATEKGQKFLTEIFARVGQQIMVSERFILSDETSLAVQQMTKKLPLHKVMYDQRKYLRAPYNDLWVEMHMTDAVRALRTNNRQGLDVRPVERIGMLIQSAGMKFRMSNYWLHTDGSLGFGLFDTHLNLEDDLPDTPLLPMQAQALRLAIETGADKDVAYNFCRRTLVLPNSYYLGAAKSFNKNADIVTMFNRVIQTAVANNTDPMSEATEDNNTLFGAWLLSMNAKSGTTKTTITRDHYKKGISFGSKKKKMQVHSHRYTVISMTDYESPEGEINDQHKRNLKNAHYVRGHFKHRATGMFWWNPFIRGSNTLQRREAYIVKEAA